MNNLSRKIKSLFVGEPFDSGKLLIHDSNLCLAFKTTPDKFNIITSGGAQLQHEMSSILVEDYELPIILTHFGDGKNIYLKTIIEVFQPDLKDMLKQYSEFSQVKYVFFTDYGHMKGTGLSPNPFSDFFKDILSNIVIIDAGLYDYYLKKIKSLYPTNESLYQALNNNY